MCLRSFARCSIRLWSLRVRSFASQIRLFEASAGQSFANRVGHARWRLLASSSAISSATTRSIGSRRIRGTTRRILPGAWSITSSWRTARRICFRRSGKFGKRRHAQHHSDWRCRCRWNLHVERCRYKTELAGLDVIMSRGNLRKLEFAGLVGPAEPDFAGFAGNQTHRRTRNHRTFGSSHHASHDRRRRRRFLRPNGKCDEQAEREQRDRFP